jgi:hypothetical protein
MRGIEEHLEQAVDDGDSEAASEEAKDNMDRDSDEASTDNDLDAVQSGLREDIDREVTDDEAGEMAEGGETEMGEEIALGETVTKGDENDPNRKTWTRIEALPTDPRTERHEETVFQNLQIRDGTTELDIFLALLPLTPAELLQIVRDGSDRCGCKYKWTVEHIFSTLCIIFGAGQLKVGTDLWSVIRKGMMPGPDFGLFLSRSRFEKVLRYWAYGPDGTEEKLPEKPWEEVDYWVRAFNKNRREELVVGTDLNARRTDDCLEGKKRQWGNSAFVFCGAEAHSFRHGSKSCL